jgi:hypothetical protein
MNKRLAAAAVLLLFLSAFPLFSQDDAESQDPVTYRFDQGDQMYFFNAGPSLSLFIWTPHQTETIEMYPLSLGGTASMGFEAFFNHNVSIGAEIGYSFAFARDNNLYTSVPLVANLSYYAVSGGVDIPITIGIGAAYNKYKDSGVFTPIVKPEVGVIWNFNDNWGLGVDMSYYFLPEFKFGTFSDQTAYNNSASVKLSLQYKQ